MPECFQLNVLLGRNDDAAASVPPDPDLSQGLLYQKLQMLDVCIAHRVRSRKRLGEVIQPPFCHMLLALLIGCQLLTLYCSIEICYGYPKAAS